MAGPVGNPQDYLVRIPVFVNSQPIDDVTSVEATLDTGITEVFTTTKGFAGFASGAKVVNIRVNLAVPLGAALQKTLWNYAHNEEWVTVQIGVGVGDFASNGKIKTKGLSNSVNNPVESSFEWTGLSAEIE
jgi:hypothetical protein